MTHNLQLQIEKLEREKTELLAVARLIMSESAYLKTRTQNLLEAAIAKAEA